MAITRSRLLKHSALLAKVLLTGLFVYFVNRGLQSDGVWSIARELRPSYVSVALLCGILGLVLQIGRWHIILGRFDFGPTIATSVRTILYGNLLAFITPGRLGELFRGLGIDRNRRGDAIVAVLLDKVFITGTIFLTGIACAWLQGAVLGIAVHPYMRIVTVAGTCGALVIGVVVLVAKRRSNVGSAIGPWASLPSFAFSRDGAAVAACSAGAHAMLLFQTVALLRMFADVSIATLMVAVGQAYSFMAFLPFFIWNLGIREHSFAVFVNQCLVRDLPRLGVTQVAFGASVGILVMNLIMPALAGLVWFVLARSGQTDPT